MRPVQEAVRGREIILPEGFVLHLEITIDKWMAES
jgi:hypothetical protein